jgi:hypothetical protein
VDLGVSFNAGANQPCGTTFNGPPAGAVNPTCSAYLNYLTHGRVRTSTPTEQISLQSSYWKQVDISGRFNYTAGNAEEFGYVENVLGRESRTNLFNGQTNGNVNGQRVAATGDFGITWHITDSWSLLDSFHYSNFHNPLEFSFSDCSFFTGNLITAPVQFVPTGLTTALPVNCIGPPGTTMVTPPAPPPNPAAPVHNGSSAADLALTVNGGFQKMEDDMNLAELDYQFSSKLGARVGFRARHRDIDYSSFVDNMEFFYPGGGGGTAANFFNAARGDCTATAGVLPAGCTAFGTNGALEFITPAVVISTPGPIKINEYSGLFGIWAKPLPNWRISFDTELMSADNTFTRISPRQSQEYRIRSTYKPVSWVNLSGSVRIWEGRDNVTQVNSLQHDRSYGFSALFTPNDKWAIDFTYDYNDVFSSILVCYPTSPSPGGIQKCPTVIGAPAQTSVYTNKSNYGGFDLMWKPVRHLTTHLGGNFTGTSGSASLLMVNANAEPASLDSKWFSPTGGVDYEFSRRWTGRAYWNYYGYHEDNFSTFQDIFAPRNFHTNSVTLSARYAF